MIRCGKCGKLYDYDRYNGICPVCARYNRRDSTSLEQELHEKYDNIPNAHSAEAHREVHKRNGEETGHGRKGKTAVICVVVIILIAFFVAVPFLRLAETGRFSSLDFSVNRFLDTGDNQDVNTEYEDHPGEAYVEYAWAQYAGTAAADIDWDALSVSLNEGDEEEIAALTDEGNGAYYLITMEIQNNTDRDLDMTAVEETDITFSLYGNEVSCRKVFYGFSDVIGSDGDYGYLDCLIYLPYEWTDPCLPDGYMSLSGTADAGQGEPMSFDLVYYFEY